MEPIWSTGKRFLEIHFLRLIHLEIFLKEFHLNTCTEIEKLFLGIQKRRQASHTNSTNQGRSNSQLSHLMSARTAGSHQESVVAKGQTHRQSGAPCTTHKTRTHNETRRAPEAGGPHEPENSGHHKEHGTNKKRLTDDAHQANATKDEHHRLSATKHEPYRARATKHEPDHACAPRRKPCMEKAKTSHSCSFMTKAKPCPTPRCAGDSMGPLGPYPLSAGLPQSLGPCPGSSGPLPGSAGPLPSSRHAVGKPSSTRECRRNWEPLNVLPRTIMYSLACRCRSRSSSCSLGQDAFGERVRVREPPLEKVNKFDPMCAEARVLGFCLGSFSLNRRGL